MLSRILNLVFATSLILCFASLFPLLYEDVLIGHIIGGANFSLVSEKRSASSPRPTAMTISSDADQAPTSHEDISSPKVDRTVIQLGQQYFHWDGIPSLCDLLRELTDVKELGSPEEISLHRREAHAAPAPLVNVTIDCTENFRNNGEGLTAGTGNYVSIFYYVKLAIALAGVDFQFQCTDGLDQLDKQVFPWLSGYYPLSRNPDSWWPKNFERPTEAEICVGTFYKPMRYLCRDIQRDMRHLAFQVLGPRNASGNYDDSVSRDLHTNLPEPLFPNEQIDDVAIHFRCGDVLYSAGCCYGFIKFEEYKRLISPDAQTIGIITQPFEESVLRPLDQSSADSCHQIVGRFATYLMDAFPSATVTIRNSPTDTEPLIWSRLIMAKQTMVGLSTFGLYPVIGTFGQGYFPPMCVMSVVQQAPDALDNLHLINAEFLPSNEMGSIEEILQWLVQTKEG